MYASSGAAGDAQRLRNAHYLQRELPIRFAQRIEELHALPFGLSAAPSIIPPAREYEIIS